MSTATLFWLISTFFWATLMSFFSMQEMACISFNRLRLELSIRSGSRRALWIKNMLENPVLLFGTTLIGVNVALVVSSESMRRLFSALDLNPNYSPCIHVPYILIFGELIPMFAARRHPEHMAKLGIPFLWLASKIFSPITLCIDFCCSLLRSFFIKNVKKKAVPHLQRDELQELLEERKRSYFDETSHESLVSRIFTLREKPVSHIMIPVTRCTILQSTLSSQTALEHLTKKNVHFALVCNKNKKILSYVQAWDLLEKKSLGSIGHTPTFVEEETTITNLILQLKKDNSPLAFVVDNQGNVSGIVTLEAVLGEITQESEMKQALTHIEKTVSADTLLSSFIKKYQVILPPTTAKTFSDLVDELLGHKPALGDIVCFGPIEITIKDVSIRGAKTVLIETID